MRSIDLALVPEACDVAVIDTSFISLTLVLPRVAELLRPPYGKPIIALVKPQFEVGRELVGKWCGPRSGGAPGRGRQDPRLGERPWLRRR